MKLRFFSSLIFLVAVANSCTDDFLTKHPLDSPASSQFFSNEKELTMAINSAYRTLYWLSGDNVPNQLFLDGATDLVWIRGAYVDMQVIQSGQFTPQTTMFNSTWSFYYQAISRCNNILDNMHRAQGRVSETFYQQIEAQARFLRAYAYHYLVNLYGDVPLVTSMLELDEAQMPKTARATVVEQMLADLDFAAAHLPDAWTGSDEGRITRGAALSLKARTALYEGLFKTAASAAGEVIASDIYSIYPDYGNLFKYAGEHSQEAILNMPFLLEVQAVQTPRYLGTRSAPGYSVIVPTQTMVDRYQATDGKQIDESAVYDASNPYDNRDPRLDQSILRPGMWYNGYLFQTHPDARTTERNVGGVISTVNNLEVTNAYATFTGYIWKKYFDEADLPANVTRSTLDFMLIRYAEVLLTYAEAKIELNQIDQTVVDAINAVRQRPSVNMPAATLSLTQEELRQLVRYERTVELAGEGFRLFDIRRWRIAEQVLPGNMLGRRTKEHWYDPVVPSFNAAGKPVYNNETTIFQVISTNIFDASKNYLWPIPQREIDLNGELVQNDGY
ncbi:RagB/SusD family nutrient uptake outer membrane protein [Parapedobacter deserti]|uniref:RagB/SusD family nutrient uptake outer membrane protein n=1 Tax=Parapedobacter deserti TaxID=1912957 RepID=A0ABV7JKB4_9SPHI